MDFAVMILSTVISLTIHEFGHAVAAASEGVPIEYVAAFLAVIFPGALVAFNSDLLQMLPNIASLRIYCAGIWHNAMLSAVCKLALFLLPFVLHPLYIHGDNPMVVGVSQSSPLYNFLSHGDVILSVDGKNVLSPHDLIEKIVIGNNRLIQGTGGERKGYCVPSAWLQERKTVMALDNRSSCPDGLVAFIDFTCLNSSLSVGASTEHKGDIKRENSYCLGPEEVVKLNKCGDGWGGTFLLSHCSCTKEEICMAPLLTPGMSWFEISYASAYSSDCLNRKRNASLVDSSPGNGSHHCGVSTFVYIGDKFQLVNSIWLSVYRPRWMHISWTAGMPTTLESFIICTCRVSAVLAILNCLPVFFLDGQYILETVLCYITWLSPWWRRKAANAFLIGGTIFSAIVFSRSVYCIIFYKEFNFHQS